MNLPAKASFGSSLFARLKSLGSSTRVISVVLLLVIVGMGLGIAFHEKTAVLTSVDEKLMAQEGAVWAPHIEKFTQDWVSADTVPVIRFAHPVIAEAMV
ncbi:MAG: hypothetical protein OEY86_16915, partial [Nitrospira sp.]|nr:hypothetical protein [Nitrospira sp.]